MIHLQQALAQHWHLSSSAYWQLRLVCTIALGPLLGVICLVLFHRRKAVGPGVSQLKRQVRVLTRQAGVRLPVRPKLS